MADNIKKANVRKFVFRGKNLEELLELNKDNSKLVSDE